MALIDALEALDPDALRAGALLAAGVAVPAGVVAQVLANDDGNGGGWVTILAVVILAALLAGAGVAARRQSTGTPLTHGIVTAVGVFVVVQAVGVVRRVLAGDDVAWTRIASSFLLSLVAGSIGGVLGGRRAGTAREPT